MIFLFLYTYEIEGFDVNTAYHTKYFANKLIIRSISNDIEKLSMSL